MSECITLYLNEKGEKHPAYYTLLNTSGHAIALQNYLKVMAPVISSNFQRHTIEDLLKMDQILRSKEPSKTSKKGPTGSKKLVGHFNDVAQARKSLVYQKALEFLERSTKYVKEDVMKSIPAKKDPIIEEFKLMATRHFEETEDGKIEFENKKNALIKRWEEDLIERRDYHNTIDQYIASYMAAFNDKSRNIETLKNFKDEFLAENPGLDRVHVQVVDQIHDFVVNQVKKGQHITIKTELHIDVPTWDNLSKIDLFVYNARTGVADIYDFKFYTEQSFEDYSTNSRGHLKDPAQHMLNNSRDFNIIQMSEYTRELNELGFPKVNSYIVPFVLTTDIAASSDSKTVYSGVKMQKIIGTRYAKADIEEILRSKGINIENSANQRYVENKISSIATLYSDAVSKSRVVSQLVLDKQSSIDSVAVVEDEDGVHRYWNEMSGTKEVVVGKTKEERVKFLESYVKIRDKYTIRLEESIINYLNNNMTSWAPGAKITASDTKVNLGSLLDMLERDFSGEGGRKAINRDAIEVILETVNKTLRKDADIEASIRQTFQGMSSSTYTFEPTSNDIRFKNYNKTIIKATNKFTGAVRLIIISPTAKPSMHYNHNNSSQYNNILGNYITTKKAKLYMVDRSDSQFDMELMMLGAIYKELKYDDPTLMLLPPKIAMLRGKGIVSRSLNLPELDHIIKVLAKVIPTDKITDEYKAILNTNLVDDETSLNHYVLDAIGALETADIYTADASLAADVSNVLSQLQTIKFSKPSNYALTVDSLISLKKALDIRFDYSHIDGDPAKYEWYLAISNLILYLEEMDPLVNVGKKDIKGKIWSNFVTMGNAQHQYLNRVNAIYKGAQTQVFNQFMERLTIHEKLTKAYMKSEGVSANTFSKETKKQLFRKLFKTTDPSTLDSSKVIDNLLVLKDDSELHSPEAKTLVKHMILMQDQMIEMYMGKQKFEEYKRSDKYIKGAMPVRKQSRESAIEEGMSKDGLMKRWMDGLAGRRVTSRSEDRRPKLVEDVDNPYMTQILSMKARLNSAGFDQAGNKVSEWEGYELEYNLDILFEEMVLNGLTQKYFGKALQIKSAADIALYAQELQGNADTGVIRDMLKGFTDLIIYQSQKDAFEEETDSAIVKWSSTLSKATLMLSPPYMIMEVLTNSFNLIGETTTQFLTKTLLQDDYEPQFTVSSMLKAVAEVTTKYDFTEKLAATYGMLIRDPSRLKSERFRPSQSSLFTSKIFFWMNSLPIEVSQTLVLIAKMIHEGSYEAHHLDSDGVLVYDETKDKRFFVQPGENISESDRKKRLAKFNFYKQEFEGEDGLNPDGTFKRAYTNTDISTVHTLTTERFASLSSDQRVLFEAGALGIAFMRFKSWMVAKKETFWKRYNPNSQLKKYLKWVPDATHEEGGVFMWVGEPSEGIFNSVFALLSGSVTKGFNSKTDLPEGLLIVRKKNAIRFINDALLFMILYLMAQKMFEKDTKKIKGENGQWKTIELPRDPFDEKLYRITGNAISDLTFIIPFYSMFINTQSSPIPLVSAGSRLATGIYGMMAAGANLDADKFVSNMNNMARVSGLIRGIEDYGIGAYDKFNK